MHIYIYGIHLILRGRNNNTARTIIGTWFSFTICPVVTQTADNVSSKCTFTMWLITYCITNYIRSTRSIIESQFLIVPRIWCEMNFISLERNRLNGCLIGHRSMNGDTDKYYGAMKQYWSFNGNGGNYCGYENDQTMESRRISINSIYNDARMKIRRLLFWL